MNSSNKKIFSLIFITVCCIILFGHFQINSNTASTNNVTVEVTNTEETTYVDPELIKSANNNYTLSQDSEITLPNKYSIEVPYISQYPELPTGCEITSLTEVLRFYGFNIDKEYMATNYLPMKDYLEPGCYINYFYGSPWSEHGSGCFSPAIITAANNFLHDNNSNLTAQSLSYSSVNTLFNELTKGHPVIVWTCFNYDAEVSYIDIPELGYELEDSGSFVSFGANLLFKAKNLPELVIGIDICEDLWMPVPPSCYHAMASATVIANLSASDETTGKDLYRRELVKNQSARLISGYIYADAGEGESSTDLVFAGHNLIAENGSILSETKRFENGMTISEIDLGRLVSERRRMSTFTINDPETHGYEVAEFEF